MAASTPSLDEIRTAEVIGSLCLATDLAMGFPFENGLQSTLVGTRLAQRLGVDPHVQRQTYFGCLLFYAGCTADAEIAASLFRPGALLEHFTPVMFGSPGQLARGIVHALANPDHPGAIRWAEGAVRLPGAARGHRQHVRAMCEVGELLSDRLGMPSDVRALLAQFTSRWDGKAPDGRSGEDIPVALRIVHVARDACFQQVLGGPDDALRIVRERAGGAFDPDVVAVLDADVLEFSGGSVWGEVMDSEPPGQLMLREADIDEALSAVGDFADLVSSYFVGHSSGVAALAARAAEEAGLSSAEATLVGRAGSVHDIGRVAVETQVWNRPGPLTADQWERVRLHPHHTERVLAPATSLARLGAVAGGHHERLDGSGYHRGTTAPSLPPAARVLGAADAYRTLIEPRPHRPAQAPHDVVRGLSDAVAAGALDADAVAAVLRAAGQHVPRLARPADLTDREAEVLALVAHGLQTKQVANRLGISAKTADRHLQNVYAKIGVSTRAAATLVAMQHGLATWGELPMADPPGRS